MCPYEFVVRVTPRSVDHVSHEEPSRLGKLPNCIVTAISLAPMPQWGIYFIGVAGWFDAHHYKHQTYIWVALEAGIKMTKQSNITLYETSTFIRKSEVFFTDGERCSARAQALLEIQYGGPNGPDIAELEMNSILSGPLIIVYSFSKNRDVIIFHDVLKDTENGRRKFMLMKKLFTKTAIYAGFRKMLEVLSV